MNNRNALSLGLIFALLTAGAGFAMPVFADDGASFLESGSYKIESPIFGGTGSIFSSSASVPPVITSGPSVTSITTSGGTVTWITDKSSSSQVFIGTVSGTYSSSIGSPSTTLVQNHAVTIDRLIRGTRYYYKVRSVDIDGNIIESSEGFFTTDPGDITPPVITTGPFLSVDSASLVTITWETNELASTVVEYGVKDVGENTLGRADDQTLFHQVKVSGLTPAQSYLWRVRTRDASGNETISATQTIATPNSPFISGFQVTDVTLTSAVVQWSTSTASTTKLEYGTSSTSYTQSIDDGAFSASHTVRLPVLASGTTYYLRVSGIDQAGNLLQSDQKVFSTVIVPQIRDMKISQITSESAVLTWTSSSAIDELLRYEIVDHPDASFIGRKLAGGNDTLVTDHSYSIADLESSATYKISVLGKDVFGNQASSDTLTFQTLPDSTPPAFVTIRSDTTIDLGSRQTVQVLVSLEMSELAKVVIEYGAGAGNTFDKKVETDTAYSRAKFLVIPGLLPGQTYQYRILAHDRSGNLTVSPSYLVLAPTQPVSLLDLIFGQISSNFGWLKNL